MASLTKKYNTKKLLGQVYTPRFVVEKILCDVGFDNENLLGKTILDPSCGDGRFLVVIAERIIKYSLKENLKENLEKIYGWDIDKNAIESCIKNLDYLIKDFDVKIDWQIEFCNSLEKINNITQKFDFIVGNPPYIRIQHLEIAERNFVQTHYHFCKSGSTDAYIAFYELCHHLLVSEGVCGLITPNSFFYNDTAKYLRNHFAYHQNIQKITNYAEIQLFKNASTYSCIMIFDKKRRDEFVYEFATEKEEFLTRNIAFSEIYQQKIWQLSLQKIENNKGKKLKDICKIHVGVTTLYDKGYIFKILENYKQENQEQETENLDNFIWVDTKLKGIIKLEKDILKPIIKASKLKNADQKIDEVVLFPYQKINEKYKIIPENELKTKYSLAYNYLISIKEELDKRDNGKKNSVAWYAFGRSQGLDTSFGKKILFSPINNKPNFILFENEECTFYSGYCIKYDRDYDFLLSQLNSKRLADFVAVSSRDFRGGWKAYNKQSLNEFEIFENENITQAHQTTQTIDLALF